MQTPLVEGSAPDLLAVVHDNDYFRRVVATGEYEQVVVMTLNVGENIGSEVHPGTDQVFIFVEGEGDAVLAGEVRSFNEGDLVYVRAGTQHDIINRGATPLRLITIYAPPEHAPGTIHRTKAEAELEHEPHRGGRDAHEEHVIELA